MKPWQEEAVLAALQDPSVPVRQAAVVWLAGKQSPALAESTFSIRETPHQFSRDALGNALANALIPFLSHDMPLLIRQSAAQALVGYNGPSSAADVLVRELVPLVSDPDAGVRSAATATLCSLGTPGSLPDGSPAAVIAPQIAPLLKSTDGEVRRDAAEVLGCLGPAAAAFAPQLDAVLEGKDRADVHVAAAEALSNMGTAGSAYLGQILTTLLSYNEHVRESVAEAIKKSSLGPDAAALLARNASLLKDRDPHTRQFMAEAVGNLASLGPVVTALTPQVGDLLRDPELEVREAAARALGQISTASKGPQPVQTGNIQRGRLGVTIRDVSDQLARSVGLDRPRGAQITAVDPKGPAAAAGIKGGDIILGVDGKPLATASQLIELLVGGSKASLQVWRNGHTATVTTRVARLDEAPQIQASAFAPQIAALLGEADPGHGTYDISIRSVAAEALANMGPAAAPFAPRIVALVRAPQSGVRFAAQRALGQMGSAAQGAVPTLVALLKDSDASVREAAAAALGAMGPAAAPAVPQLVELLKDPAASNSAVEALGKIGSAAAPALPKIVALFTELDGKFADRAEGALSAMGPAAAPVAPQLAVLLGGSSSTRVRANAAVTLGHLGPEVAGTYAPQLAALLKAPTNGFFMGSLREGAINALGEMGPAAAALAPQVAALLGDKDSSTRRAAAKALGKMGPAGAAFAPQIAALLRDSDAYLRAAAAEALDQLGNAVPAPLLAGSMGDVDAKVRGQLVAALDRFAMSAPLQDRAVLFDCLSAGHALPTASADFVLRAYLYRRVNSRDLILIRWLGNRSPVARPAAAGVSHEQAVAVLRVLSDSWDEMKPFPALRTDAADRMAEVVGSQQWELTDVPLLGALQARMAPEFHAQALTVQAVLDRNLIYSRLENASVLIGTHIAAWTALLFAYPRRRWVQSFFFWNKWARRFLGVGYVGLLITLVPALRRRMLRPFQASFLPQGIMEQFNKDAYFPDCEVRLEKNRRVEPGRLPLKEAVPGIRGEVVLKGQSGLGKTLLLLRLALATREPVVFLRASECSKGVVAAIQKKVQGQVRDGGYLRSLIYAGGIKVLIDGLNEASPEARARITQFVEEYFNGDFILTTQPMGWEPPATARVYVLQPLLPGQIEPFLLRQWDAVKDRAALDQERYQEAVARYMQAIGKDSPQDPTADPRIVALSNPMDATLAAELLARGETPDVFRLVEQRYQVMAADFRDREGREFQLKRFSERIYEWRKSSEPDINTEGFEAEVAALARDRLMIARTEIVRKDKGEVEVNRWFFRHDRIMEFFLLPAFMGENSKRRQEHDLDEQFWGLYELLAVRLPEAEEQNLRDFLMERAADTERNELLNRYTVARRFRTQTTADEHALPRSVAV
jgi:HEAT repeat protein